VLTCESCNLGFSEDSVFCPKCGIKLQEKLLPVQQDLDSQDVLDLSVDKGEVEPNLVDRKKTSPKNKLIAVLVIALIAIAIPVNNSFQESRRQAAEELLSEMESQSLAEAFSGELLYGNFTDCSLINVIMGASTYPDLDAQAEESKKISDARQALEFVGSNSLTATALKAKYESDLDTLIYGSLDSLYLESDRDEIAPEYQLSTWRTQWKDAVLTACDLAADNTSITSNLTNLDSEFNRITTLADSVPWYPEGFNEYEEGIAIDWVSGGRDPCFTDCVYWTLDVISQYGCPSGLYVETTFARDGSAFDWTNDTLPSLNPGQKGRLQFYTYEFGSSTSGMNIEIAKVSCT
jgi:hypothetical protein